MDMLNATGMQLHITLHEEEQEQRLIISHCYHNKVYHTVNK